MAFYTNCILTNMCMISDGDKVLVQDRTDKSWSGIAFPGGHIEPRESISDSVIREVYEETGLVVESPHLIGVKNWVRSDGTRYIVFLFAADRFSGELRSSDEGEVFWVNRADLEAKGYAPNLEPIMNLINKGTACEIFWDKDSDRWEYR